MNRSARALEWVSRITTDGRLTSHRDSRMRRLGVTRGPDGARRTRVRIEGADWNGALRAGARTTFGYCGTRFDATGR